MQYCRLRTVFEADDLPDVRRQFNEQRLVQGEGAELVGRYPQLPEARQSHPGDYSGVVGEWITLPVLLEDVGEGPAFVDLREHGAGLLFGDVEEDAADEAFAVEAHVEKDTLDLGGGDRDLGVDELTLVALVEAPGELLQTARSRCVERGVRGIAS